MKKSLLCRIGLHKWGAFMLDTLQGSKDSVTVRHCERPGCAAFKGDKHPGLTNEFHKWLRDECGVPF